MPDSTSAFFKGGQKRVIQHLEGQVQLFIQACPNHLVVGKEGVVLFRLLAGNGVLHLHLPHLLKGLLVTDRGIHFLSVKGRQVVLIQPFQLFGHVHISVEIDIAVGRVVICFVEIQELLIGQLRDHVRVAAGLICIGGIREQGI